MSWSDGMDEDDETGFDPDFGGWDDPDENPFSGSADPYDEAPEDYDPLEPGQYGYDDPALNPDHPGYDSLGEGHDYSSPMSALRSWLTDPDPVVNSYKQRYGNNWQERLNADIEAERNADPGDGGSGDEDEQFRRNTLSPNMKEVPGVPGDNDGDGVPDDINALADAQRYAGGLGHDAAQRSIAAWDELIADAGESLRPWREAGTWALDQLKTGLEQGVFRKMAGDVPEWQGFSRQAPEWEGFDREAPEFEGFSREDLAEDEGYLFRREQGERSIRRNENVAGGTRSGAFYARTAEFNQGLASDEYDRGYQRALSSYGAERAGYADYRESKLQDYGAKRAGYGDYKEGEIQDYNMRRLEHGDRTAKADRYFGRISSLAGAGQTAVNQYLGVKGRGIAGRNQMDVYGAEALGKGEIGYNNAIVGDRRFREALEAEKEIAKLGAKAAKSSSRSSFWGTVIGTAIGAFV